MQYTTMPAINMRETHRKRLKPINYRVYIDYAK